MNSYQFELSDSGESINITAKNEEDAIEYAREGPDEDINWMDIPKKVNNFEHDCEACVFLGAFDWEVKEQQGLFGGFKKIKVDLWDCHSSKSHVITARFGDNPEECLRDLVSNLRGQYQSLLKVTAGKLALGFIKERDEV